MRNIALQVSRTHQYLEVFSANTLTECQKLDWKAHKTLCSFMKDPRPDSDSDTEYRRALFIPGENQAVKLVWVETLASTEGGGPQVDLKKWLGKKHTGEPFKAYYNMVQARPLSQDGQHHISAYGLRRGSVDSNTQALTRAGATTDLFGGPILVLKANDTSTLGDMEFRDVRSFVDCMSSASRYLDTPLQPQLESKHAFGVRVAAEQLPDGNYSQSVYEIVLEYADHVFSGSGSSIANMLGIPLAIRKASETEPTGVLKAFTGEPAGENPMCGLITIDVASTTVLSAVPHPPFNFITQAPPTELEFLGESRLRPSAGRLGFGTPPAMYDGADVGPVVIVRYDGKPFLIQHVQCLAAYIERHQPDVQAAIAGVQVGAEISGRQNILQGINKESFEKFWEQYKANQISNGNVGWKGVCSPYNMTAARVRKFEPVTARILEEQSFEQFSEVRKDLEHMF